MALLKYNRVWCLHRAVNPATKPLHLHGYRYFYRHTDMAGALGLKGHCRAGDLGSRDLGSRLPLPCLSVICLFAATPTNQLEPRLSFLKPLDVSGVLLF